jgi:hypothetical protein
VSACKKTHQRYIIKKNELHSPQQNFQK